MNQPETILVTGATGNVGRPLVEQLIAAGYRVRALSRDPVAANLPPATEVIPGNITDTANLDGAFEGVTATHLISFGDDLSELTNAAEIIELAADAGVRRATVLHGGMAHNPLHAALDASPLEWTSLAPVEFMSNALEWADAVRTEGVVRAGFAEAKSAMIHPADIAAVAVTALTREGHGGREYWLTGPESLTTREKIRTIGTTLGREVRYIELDRDQTIAKWRTFGYTGQDIEFFLAMQTDPPEAGYTVLPTVREVTGEQPRTFARWVKENAAAFTA